MINDHRQDPARATVTFKRYRAPNEHSHTQQDPSGREYFLNTETWETRWELPPEPTPDPMPESIPDWTWPETGFHGFIEFGGRGVTGLTISKLDKVSHTHMYVLCTSNTKICVINTRPILNCYLAS